MPAGRPRKIYIEGEEPIPVHILLPRDVIDALPHDKTMTECIKETLIAAYCTEEARQREEIAQSLRRFEELASAERAKLAAMDRKTRIQRELREKQLKSEKYLVTAFQELMKVVEREHIHEVAFPDMMISRQYGIWVDKKVLNQNRDTVMGELAAESEHEIVVKYGLKKTQKGKLEPSIMAAISPTG